MEKEYKFDAFISYRHTELDKFVAENLHKQLESFRLPKNIAKKRSGEKNRINRVFRDKEELPLTSNLEEPILEALHSSEWLIVICSPRLRESIWCKKEIETFVKLRGRERVLAVLIEGEPADSFPDELLYRVETRTLPDGRVEEVKIPVEPLAADMRGKSKKEVLKAMKTEIMRLLAAMFQLDYDDLRQRHKERRMRRIVTASLIGGAACLLFGVYSTATALRIQKQKEQIELQSQEIQLQSAEIQRQNNELSLRQAHSMVELATRSLEDGDRSGAILLATEALTESDGIAMPYTPEAQMILADCLRAYDTGNVFKAEYQYKTAGRIDDLFISDDMDTLCIYDDTQTLVLYDLINRKELKVFTSAEYDSYGTYHCSFLGEDKFIYVDTEDKLCVYDLNTQEVIQSVEVESSLGVHTDRDGKYIASECWNNSFEIYDAASLELLGTTPKIEAATYIYGPYFSENDILACAYSDESGDYYKVYFFDLRTMETVSVYDAGESILEDMTMKDGIAYMVMGEYAQYYLTADASVIAMDIATGNVIWKHEQPGYFPKKIKLPANEGASQLLFVTNASASLLNMETGEKTYEEPISEGIASAYVHANENSYVLYTKEGNLLFIRAADGMAYDLSHTFECKTQTNEEILHSQYGITVWARNDNKITIYTQKTGAGVVAIDEEHPLPKEEEIMPREEVFEIATSLGLENPKYVNYLFYSQDKRYCFVSYFNYDLVIYDMEAGQVVTTMEEAYPTNWYQEADESGQSYLLGYHGCYVLNADMKPIMYIPRATQIDAKNKKVYITWNLQNYEAPLYTLEELLEMAKTYN